jgi:putative oxidoreductase
MNMLLDSSFYTLRALDWFGGWLPQLALRVLLAYEFWESGIEKLRGENWFGDVMDKFPYPLNLVPVDISWLLATWSELIGAVCLLIGLATRFFSFTLIVLDIVAWYAVHAGNGYNVCDNGYKLPLIYLVLLLPLLFGGPGKASIDYLIARASKRF